MPANNDFKKKFVLFVCECLLCPDESLSTLTNLWNALEPVEQISSYNWAVYAQLNLWSELKTYHSKKPMYNGGCVLFLMILYLDHMALMNHRANRAMPRVKAWTDVAIKESLSNLTEGRYKIDSVTSEGQQTVLHVANEDQCAEKSYSDAQDTYAKGPQEPLSMQNAEFQPNIRSE